MKKAVMLAALLCGGASAVNFAQMKQEDVCVDPYSFGIDIFRESQFVDETIPVYGREILIQSLYTLGFNVAEECRFKILGRIQAIPHANGFHMYVNFFIRDTTVKGLDVPNIGYFTYVATMDPRIETLQFQGQESFKKMFQEFAKDWFASHP